MSPEHVEALNAIDLVFRKDKKVREAWKVYFDHLNAVNEKDVGAWSQRADDYLVDLLAEMSRALKYDFDKVQLRRGIYSPRAHGEAELDSLVIRKSLAAILSFKQPIPVAVIQPNPPAAAQAKVIEAQAAEDKK